MEKIVGKVLLGTQNNIVPAIRCLGEMNQLLIHKSLSFGLLQEAKMLQKVDFYLTEMLRKSVSFDFVAEISLGRTLLVGEGNLSFALALSKMPQIVKNKLIVTTFEDKSGLSGAAADNAELLRNIGITVLHGVDATNLYAAFGSWFFANIVFQFPHSGSREPIEGHNPNFILIRDFLKSCATQLQSGGKVFISAIDSPHYRGAFQFEDAARAAGFNPPEVYAFDPDAFPGYEHNMTHQGGSALENHGAFSTWVFRV